MAGKDTLRIAQEAYSTPECRVRLLCDAYSGLRIPLRVGCEAQTINETLTWGTVTKVMAFAVDVDMRYKVGSLDLPLDFRRSGVNMYSLGKVEKGVPIKNVTTGAPVARMAVRGTMADLRRAIERCWPVHVDDHPRFLVAGREFEVGEYSTAVIFARAPTQPARDALPDGLARGFVLSALEVEFDGERTPVYVHPDDATHLQAHGTDSANPSNDGGFAKVIFCAVVYVITFAALTELPQLLPPKDRAR